jgi:transcription initiation factor TFIIIB Brf1 subunit/transcription initiation factor TFIIB
MSDLTLASDRVDDVLAAFNLPNETEARALELVEKADWDWPINRSPSGIAAAAVYLAALEHDNRLPQAPIAEAAGCTQVTLRDTYHEMYLELRYPDPTERDRESEGDAGAPERWPNPARLEELGSGGAVDD